jgi:hypothetical protein
MGFPYTEAIERVLELIVGSSSLFRHVRLERILVSFAQTRKRTPWGTFAKLVPLRFEGGALRGVEDGMVWEIAEYSFRGRDVLYILYVYLPRFHELDFRAKVLTLFHELYHVSPAMDGDLRRIPGPNPFHGPSREWFDDQLRPHVEDFLDRLGSSPELDFLREELSALQRRHEGILGLQVKQPEMRRLGPA